MDKEEFMNRQPEQNSGNENKENTNRPAYRRVNVYDGTGRSGNKEEYNNRRAYGDRSYGGNSRRRDGESYFRQRGNNANYNSERNHNPYGGNYSDRRRGYGSSYDESAEYNRGKYSYNKRPRVYEGENDSYSLGKFARKEARGGRYEYRSQQNNPSGAGYGSRRKHSQGYDPNSKYSLPKRIQYAEENFDPDAPIRLNKFLANAGVCSRRDADKYIQAGVVTVNGEIVTELGTKVKRSDEVRFHNEPVSPEKKVYVLLNKPKDYVTTSDDPQKRKTVMELVRNACKERIYPVGRLDRNTTGVLLLTNAGSLLQS